MLISQRNLPGLLLLGTALTVAGCGGEQSSEPVKQGGAQMLRMGGAPVTTPVIETVQQIANDGYSGTTYISNNWGGHQVRVTHHNDGTVRVLYLTRSTDPVSTLAWHVMKQASGTTTWTEEMTGVSTGDVNLLRDPGSDTALVVAFPNSVPTVYAGSTSAATVIPGPWQNVLAKNRHYSAAGIGSDGTLCFKTSVESTTAVPTSDTATHYICGKYSTATGWAWNAKQVQQIGKRYAYDYLFPNGFGDGRLTAIAQSDLSKDAAGYPALPASTYIFHGFRNYSVDTNGQNWTQQDLLGNLPGSATETNYSALPQARIYDSFIDSANRVFSTYLYDPGNGVTRYFVTVVSDSQGQIIQTLTGPAVASFGTVRIFEDGSHRLWYLWSAQSNRQTNVYLYPITRNASGSTYSIGATPYNLSAAVFPYSLYGSVYLAMPRGGQSVGNSIDAFFPACDAFYPGNNQVMTASCLTGENAERIVYFRLRLPD
jgi:hypothetical protein